MLVNKDNNKVFVQKEIYQTCSEYSLIDYFIVTMYCVIKLFNYCWFEENITLVRCVN